MSATVSDTQSLSRPELRPLTPAADRIARLIDHTRLIFAADEDPVASVGQLCREAIENTFCAVCVRPEHILVARKALGDQVQHIKVATVIGFPDERVALDAEIHSPTVGNVPLITKLEQIRLALGAGADELDVVMNVGLFKLENQKGKHFNTLAELRAVQHAANGRPVKVIIETDLLNDDEIRLASRLCAEAGVDIVKTCTGMVVGGRGATPEIIRMIRETLAESLAGLEPPVVIGIKASGGIRTAAQAQALVAEGATRIGTSNGKAIIDELAGSQSSAAKLQDY
jgi:deoxyribose-phosphate aldolase